MILNFLIKIFLTIKIFGNKVLSIRPSRLSTMRNLDGHYPFLGILVFSTTSSRLINV